MAVIYLGFIVHRGNYLQIICTQEYTQLRTGEMRLGGDKSGEALGMGACYFGSCNGGQKR